MNRVRGEPQRPVHPHRRPHRIGVPRIDGRRIVTDHEVERRQTGSLERGGRDLDGRGIRAAHILQHRLENRVRRQGDPLAIGGTAGDLRVGRDGLCRDERQREKAHECKWVTPSHTLACVVPYAI